MALSVDWSNTNDLMRRLNQVLLYNWLDIQNQKRSMQTIGEQMKGYSGLEKERHAGAMSYLERQNELMRENAQKEFINLISQDEPLLADMQMYNQARLTGDEKTATRIWQSLQQRANAHAQTAIDLTMKGEAPTSEALGGMMLDLGPGKTTTMLGEGSRRATAKETLPVRMMEAEGKGKAAKASLVPINGLIGFFNVIRKEKSGTSKTVTLPGGQKPTGQYDAAIGQMMAKANDYKRKLVAGTLTPEEDSDLSLMYKLQDAATQIQMAKNVSMKQALAIALEAYYKLKGSR